VCCTCHVVPCASPTLPFVSPSPPPICHLLIYFPYAACTHDRRQCTTPTFCTRFPQPPAPVLISSHCQHAAPYPVVARAKLFAVHSWQSAPETVTVSQGGFPPIWGSASALWNDMTRYIVSTYFLIYSRSSKHVSVGFSFASTPTAKRTSVRYTAESGCYKWQYFSRYCIVNLSREKSHAPLTLCWGPR